MSEQKALVRSYRWKDEPEREGYSSFGYNQPKKAEDHAAIFADLWTRIETLSAAKRPILLSLDKDHLHLSTMVPAPPPEPSGFADGPARKPAKRARATKKEKS